MALSVRLLRAALLVVVLATVALAPPAAAAGPRNPVALARAKYWTAERMAAAIPRDLVVDEHGQGYLREPGGSLRPHGEARPIAQVGGPSITNVSPASGATIGSAHEFSATVTDPDGVKSVAFRVQKSGATAQTINAVHQGSNVWAANLQGFTDGSWTWSITAKDRIKRGNSTTAGPFSFTVDTGSGGGGGGGGTDPVVVENEEWTQGGAVQTAIGRVYFEMPANRTLSKWTGYVCSGTVANDGAVGNGRSVIITAAHCVYDDVNKAFARNVIFIPNQAATTGTGTDRDCTNDPMGCWSTSYGVVDVNWTNRAWPSNIPWDYAYYAVADDAHAGNGTGGPLDGAAGSLPVDFTAPDIGAQADALGYSYSEDPKLMHCGEELGTEDSYNDLWLGSCGLSGGSSGGPWFQPLDGGTGSIISVNSWGYSTQPGMAGPRLHNNTASCLFTRAKTTTANYAGGC